MPSSTAALRRRGIRERSRVQSAVNVRSFRARAWLKDCCKSFRPMRGSFELLGSLQTPRRLIFGNPSGLAGWVLQGPRLAEGLLQILQAHAWVLRAPWDPSNPSTIEAEGFLEILQALRGGSFRAHARLKDSCKPFRPIRGSFELFGILQTPRRSKLKDFWKSFRPCGVGPSGPTPG